MSNCTDGSSTLVLGVIMFAIGCSSPCGRCGRITPCFLGARWLDMTFAMVLMLRGVINVRTGAGSARADALARGSEQAPSCRIRRHMPEGRPKARTSSGTDRAKIVITPLGEFVDRVTPQDTGPVTGRRRDTGVYRGASDAGAPLLTTLDRLGGIDPPHRKADLEEHVLRNYIRYSRPHVRCGSTNDWEELISAQHHGVPTRLLDWTYSPLVGRSSRATCRTVRNARARCGGSTGRRSMARFAFRLAGVAAARSRRAVRGGGHRSSPWEFFARDREASPFACLVEPPVARRAHRGAGGGVHDLLGQMAVVRRFLTSHGLAVALTHYVIPAECVTKLRDQLDLVGVDERRLFPDLDGVAAAIRRYYG